jgi:hypothetical protein
MIYRMSVILSLFYLLHMCLRCESITSKESTTLLFDDENYPMFIPTYEVRKDFYTQEPVERNRVNLIANITKTPTSFTEFTQVSLDSFKRALQCAPYQPLLHDKLFSLIKSSRAMIELISTYLESDCKRWVGCNTVINGFKQGKYPKGLSNHLRLGPYHPGARMLRIRNGTLHLDWPWGVDRFSVDYNHITPFLYILLLVRDIPDSVFISGEERSVMPYDIPFPAFSCSPGVEAADMPAIWPKSFVMSMKLHRKLNRYLLKQMKMSSSSEIDEILDEIYTPQTLWDERIPKATFK